MPLEKVTTGERCCPKCSGDAFLHATCKDACKKDLEGFRYECIKCNWRGFGLQLVRKTPAAEHERSALSIEMEAEAEASIGSKADG